MPFISESLDDVTEAKPAREGEYDLRIIKAEEKPSKLGKIMAEVIIAFDDQVEAPPIRHYMVKWNSDTPADQIRMRKLEFKRFFACFHINPESEVEDWVGATGRSLVTQEEGEDGNMYNRLKLPRLSG